MAWVYVALCSWEECIFVSIVNDNDFLRNCEPHALALVVQFLFISASRIIPVEMRDLSNVLSNQGFCNH